MRNCIQLVAICMDWTELEISRIFCRFGSIISFSYHKRWIIFYVSVVYLISLVVVYIIT